MRSTRSDFILDAFRSEEEDRCTLCVDVVDEELDDLTLVVVELLELDCNLKYFAQKESRTFFKNSPLGFMKEFVHT